jgi:hypothetical protein
MLLKGFYNKSKRDLKVFVGQIKQEKIETKVAFKLLITSIETGVPLTSEEKKIIGVQMKDVFKTIGIIGIAILPGGVVFFILTRLLKINKYILPSSFEECKKI